MTKIKVILFLFKVSLFLFKVSLFPMEFLSGDELGVVLSHLHLDDMQSMIATSKYYFSYYNNNEQRLLKFHLGKIYGFIMDNYTLKELCILLKNYKDRIMRNKGAKKIIKGSIYTISLHDDRVEFKGAGGSFKINGEYIDIANKGHRTLLLKTDKVYVYLGPMYSFSYDIPDIKQVETTKHGDYFLSNDGVAYCHSFFSQDNDIEPMNFPRNVVKIFVDGAFTSALLSNNTVSNLDTQINISGVIDLIINGGSYVYLTKNGDVYYSGKCGRNFSTRYLKNNPTRMSQPFKLFDISNIVGIATFGTNIILMNTKMESTIIDTSL
jgi:hypothetical protein